ncbi:ATP-binding protein [Microcoleus sp. N3A4]|uniref:ATP-binding protein n=1 Tax=Microcoleus sp. N3A4 TaxID=3055379 RepID=UPI002FD25772
MKESFFLSLRFQMTIGVLLGVVPPMLAAIWFASFHAANIIRSQAKQNLELKADVLTESISRWEQMNIRVLHSISQNPNTVSMNASKQLPLLIGINRSYSHIYLAEAYNLEGYVVARGSGTPPDRINRSDRYWFKSAVAGTEITRETLISRLTGKPAVIFSTPIREFASLSLGDRGNSVSQLQQQLKQLGYYKNEITGIYGNTTADAVAQFQKKYSGLPVDGSVDFTTKQLLELATNFQQKFSQTHQLNSSDKPADQLGKIQGVAIIGILLSDLARAIGTVRIGKTGFAFLVDKKGQLIAHPDEKLFAEKQLINLSNYPPVKTLLGGKSGAFYFADERGVKWLSCLNQLDSGWGVIILQEEAEVLEKEELFWQFAITIAAIAVLGVGGLTWILTSRLVRPIGDLTVAAAQLSSGDWNQRVNIDRQDELGTLAKAFNRMAVQLQKLFASLEAKNQEADNARTEAEKASKAKSLFMANMSHELRTPLNAIMGYSEILEEEACDLNCEELVPDLQRINNASKHLLSLINDILDISKIEAGRIELYLETCEISAIIDDVATTIKPLVEKNSNVLTVNCPPDIGTFYTDLTKIYQCLLNLLSNASKFTEAGEITLEVSRFRSKKEEGKGKKEEVRSKSEEGRKKTGEKNIFLGQEKVESDVLGLETKWEGETSEKELESDISAGEEWISFKVSDTGIGMNAEQIERVFQAFTQADESTTRRYGGTGLGLAIAKKFCQIMGGDISLESELGKGSVFTIKLPAIVAKKAAS